MVYYAARRATGKFLSNSPGIKEQCGKTSDQQGHSQHCNSIYANTLKAQYQSIQSRSYIYILCSTTSDTLHSRDTNLKTQSNNTINALQHAAMQGGYARHISLSRGRSPPVVLCAWVADVHWRRRHLMSKVGFTRSQ